MCMALNKTDQERLLTFGTMAGTKAANGGRMHEEHMMQRVRAEEPVTADSRCLRNSGQARL